MRILEERFCYAVLEGDFKSDFNKTILINYFNK